MRHHPSEPNDDNDTENDERGNQVVVALGGVQGLKDRPELKANECES